MTETTTAIAKQGDVTTALREKQEQSLAQRGLTFGQFKTLRDMVWPCPKGFEEAEHERAVWMAIDYCKARTLDPFKKPVHLVPVWSGKANRNVLGLWPGINDYRTTAFRTQQYAGKDETKFGPTIKENIGGAAIEYPAWAQVTVYRMLSSQRCAFPGPKVYWKETYAKAAHNTPKPNDRWERAPFGQLEKCAEAAALRAAFPEEIGGQPTAEEMEGKTIDGETEILPPTTDVPRGPILTQEETNALAGRDPEIEAEIEGEMEGETTPPAAGAGPGSEPGEAPAETAETSSGGEVGPPSRNRRGAKDSTASPQHPAAGGAPSPAPKGAGHRSALPGGGEPPAKPSAPKGLPFGGRDATPADCEAALKEAMNQNPAIGDPFDEWWSEQFGPLKMADLRPHECANVMEKIAALSKKSAQTPK